MTQIEVAEYKHTELISAFRNCSLAIIVAVEINIIQGHNFSHNHAHL